MALLAALIVCVIAILGGWYLLLLQKQIANQAPTLAETPATQTECTAAVTLGPSTPKSHGTCSGAGAARERQRKLVAQRQRQPRSRHN